MKDFIPVQTSSDIVDIPPDSSYLISGQRVVGDQTVGALTWLWILAHACVGDGGDMWAVIDTIQLNLFIFALFIILFNTDKATCRGGSLGCLHNLF